MKTFFTVKFALLPIAVFVFLIVRGMPAAAIWSGLSVALVVAAWRLYARQIKSLELATLAIFAAMGAGLVVAPDAVVANALPLAFAGLGVFSIATVLWRKPWTAEFSLAAYPGADGNPLFVLINMILSALWGILFLLIGVAHALKAGSIVTTAIVVTGALASIFGPRLLIRTALARRLRSRESYHWPAPAFGAAAGGDDVDVAVVGAGIGGLTTAALLADAGLKVVVAEQHFQPGGFCQSFQRKLHHDGAPCVYSFDAGPHDFSGVWPGGPLSSVLERLDVARCIEWRRIQHTYRSGNQVLDVPEDWRAYVAELARRFPGEASGLASLFTTIRAIFDGMYSPLTGSGGIPGLGMTIETMQDFARQHPLALQWIDKPFDELLAAHITDPEAKRFVTTLTGYISDGSESLSCGEMVPLFGYYFHGGYHPVGGGGKLAKVLAAAIAERGGKVWLNSPVKKICVKDGRACGLALADGRNVSARAIVANSDLKRTFLELVEPADLPGDFRARIAAAEPATSAFTVHLGVDLIPDMRPAVIARGDPNIGITAMSLLDPAVAPPGHSTLTLIRLLPQAEARGWFPQANDANGDQWRHSAEYGDRKRRIGDEMIAAAEKIIPGLSGHIVYRDEASPVTFCRYDQSTAGAIYGVRKPDRFVGSKSPIAGLVIAGSATHGPGVEAAVISGAYAADALVPGLLARPPAPVRKSAA